MTNRQIALVTFVCFVFSSLMVGLKWQSDSHKNKDKVLARAMETQEGRKAIVKELIKTDRVPNATVAQSQENIRQAYAIVNKGFPCPKCEHTMQGITYGNGSLVRALTLDKGMKWYDVYELECPNCGYRDQYRHPCPHLDIRNEIP